MQEVVDLRAIWVLVVTAITVTPLFAREPVPFSVGEKLVFAVEYGPISAGTATMEVREIAEVNGRTCYHIVSLERTNDFFSRFFKIRDRYDSYIDTTSLATVRFEKDIEPCSWKCTRGLRTVGRGPIGGRRRHRRDGTDCLAGRLRGPCVREGLGRAVFGWHAGAMMV